MVEFLVQFYEKLNKLIQPSIYEQIKTVKSAYILFAEGGGGACT